MVGQASCRFVWGFFCISEQFSGAKVSRGKKREEREYVKQEDSVMPLGEKDEESSIFFRVMKQKISFASYNLQSDWNCFEGYRTQYKKMHSVAWDRKGHTVGSKGTACSPTVVIPSYTHQLKR